MGVKHFLFLDSIEEQIKLQNKIVLNKKSQMLSLGGKCTGAFFCIKDGRFLDKKKIKQHSVIWREQWKCGSILFGVEDTWLKMKTLISHQKKLWNTGKTEHWWKAERYKLGKKKIV